MHHTERVASVNMRVTVDEKPAEAGLLHVAEHADIIAAQEWKSSRNGILRRMGRLTRHPRLGRDQTTGWTWTRPVRGGPPIGFRAERYRLLAVYSRHLAPSQRLARVIGRRSDMPESRATIALARDRTDGRVVAVVNYHLTADVQDRHGDYKPGDRADRHRHEVRALRRIVRRQLRKGRRVYAVGDGNFDGLQIPPLVSCWQGHPGIGTLGNRAVDYVHAERPAESVVVIASASDHRHPVATYSLR